MEEENNTQNTTTEGQTEPDMIERANEAAESLRKETAALRSEREKLERLRVSETLGGRSEAGSGPKKELSDAEYARAALRGELRE